MPIDRRQLLLAGAASLLGCKPGVGSSDDPTPEPSLTRDPSPGPFEPAGTLDLHVFPWGVYVGDATVDAAEIRVRTTAADIEVVCVEWVEGAWVELERKSLTPDEVTASTRLERLAAKSSYCVWAESGGVRSAVSQFRTPPDAGDLYELHIGASSCFGRASSLNNLVHTRTADLDAFVQVGDYCYTDGSTTIEGYTNIWDEYLTRAGSRALASSVGLIHTWDDHEVANNWTLQPGTNDTITAAKLEVATITWKQIMPMALQGDRVWRKHAWGDIADFFVLDCRGERGVDTMVSEAQLAWFEEAMRTSTATFKIVLSSVHLTDHTELFAFVQDRDRWQGYPAQRARMVATCANTPGTLVITGDMHYGAVQRLDPTGAPGAQVWEIAAGPSGSTLLPVEGITDLSGVPEQYDFLLENWSWCDLRLNPGTMRVVVDFIGDSGDSLGTRELQL